MHTKTDRKGQTITYTYTDSGRLSTITYPDNSVTSYNYDLRDNLTQRQDSYGTTSYNYDAVNRVTALTDANGFTTGYEYDAAGNVIRITYPGSKTVSYTYDAVNRLATVSVDWPGKTAGYSYDDAGRLIGLDQFNGTISQCTYDDANRLEVNRSGTSTRYIYDMNGNLIAEADANNVIIRYYIYGKGIMAMATYNGGLYCYHFDATGHTI